MVNNVFLLSIVISSLKKFTYIYCLFVIFVVVVVAAFDLFQEWESMLSRLVEQERTCCILFILPGNSCHTPISNLSSLFCLVIFRPSTNLDNKQQQKHTVPVNLVKGLFGVEKDLAR